MKLSACGGVGGTGLLMRRASARRMFAADPFVALEGFQPAMPRSGVLGLRTSWRADARNWDRQHKA